MDEDARWFRPGPALVILGAIAGLVVGGIVGLATAAGEAPKQPRAATATTAAPPATVSLAGQFYIVQVASDRDQPTAERNAGDLRGRGFQANVLKSDDYAPLRGGYFVVYVGPFQATPDGKVQAQAQSARLGGRPVRLVAHR
jgi:cell division septation protein DedD